MYIQYIVGLYKYYLYNILIVNITCVNIKRKEKYTIRKEKNYKFSNIK